MASLFGRSASQNNLQAPLKTRWGSAFSLRSSLNSITETDPKVRLRYKDTAKHTIWPIVGPIWPLPKMTKLPAGCSIASRSPNMNDMRVPRVVEQSSSKSMTLPPNAKVLAYNLERFHSPHPPVITISGDDSEGQLSDSDHDSLPSESNFDIFPDYPISLGQDKIPSESSRASKTSALISHYPKHRTPIPIDMVSKSSSSINRWIDEDDESDVVVIKF